MSKPKILIIDDEYSFAEFAREILELNGYEAVVCLEGFRAMEQATAEKPQLILMDINMPGMNGIEALRRLKENPATKDIPVIICSLSENRQDVRQALDCGAINFVSKSSMNSQLRSSVAKALGGRS